MPDDLDRLRARLARVDARLRQDVRRRLALARSIGAAKRKAELPIRAPTVERAVVGRWQDGLEELGIPPDRALILARWLVDEAIRVQEEGGPRHPVTRRKILVIGGAGEMGRWLTGFARVMGHDVRVLDPNRTVRLEAPRELSLARGAAWADVIVVATPIGVAPKIYADLWRTGTRAVIFDILSVKASLLAAIRRGRARGFHVASVHPLFGPKVRPLSGHNLLVLDCGDARATEAAADLFRPSSLSVSVLPIAEHDVLMADLQALPRVVNLLFAAALTRAGRRRQELARTETPSFRRQAEVARIVLSENPELSLALLARNPGTPQILRRLDHGLADLRRTLRAPDRGEYRSTLARGKRLLGPSSNPAIRSGSVQRARRSTRARR
ncbi:MAG: prephenate dehydrogenase/arogenate dehydrogenase family protein [Thermoplasmata archaeon]|nr:prephenate dehydrogenase/arogenate dehydrogenase family protein [Thermoplasmata archaeon]